MKIKNKTELRKEIKNAFNNTAALQRITFYEDGTWVLSSWGTYTEGTFSFQLRMFFSVPFSKNYDIGLTRKFKEIEWDIWKFYKLKNLDADILTEDILTKDNKFRDITLKGTNDKKIEKGQVVMLDVRDGTFITHKGAEENIPADISKLFTSLYESLEDDDQDVMCELEQWLAKEFDRDGRPVQNQELYDDIVTALKEKGLI